MTSPTPKHLPADLVTLAVGAREQRVVQLRTAGLSWDQIAASPWPDAASPDTLYSDRSGAWKAWQRAIRHLRADTTTEARTLELMRLDQLLRAVWPLALQGELPAIDRALAIGAQRQKLLGLLIDQVVTVDATTVSVTFDGHAAITPVVYDVDESHEDRPSGDGATEQGSDIGSDDAADQT